MKQEIRVELIGNQLTIVCEEEGKREPIRICEDANFLSPHRIYISDILLEEESQKYKVFFCKSYQKTAEIYSWQDKRDDLSVIVWTCNGTLKYGLMRLLKTYQDMIKVFHKLYYIGLHPKYLSLWYSGYIKNPVPGVEISDIRLSMNHDYRIPIDMMVLNQKATWKQKLSRSYFHHYKIPLDTDVVYSANTLKFVFLANDEEVHFTLKKPVKKEIPSKEYYRHVKNIFTKKDAIFLRRNAIKEIILVRRERDPHERGFRFWLLENNITSAILFYLGRCASKLSKTKVNLFYEKNSQKAEEGTYELFLKAKQSPNSKSYFIIEENTEDYERIKNEPGVVKKYSLLYYWLMYRVDAYISTDAPAHVHLLRTNNKYIRRMNCTKPFIFLQHGVTYMKRHGNASAYVAGKEAEPDLLVVGGEKEAKICESMFMIDADRILQTGLPIFDKIEYEHITQSSEDIVVVMLTWKREDEKIPNFIETSYYQNVSAIYQMLSKRVKKEQIVLVPHPKVASSFADTQMDSVIWKRPISEALAIGKLLITDYSSTCYNSFYQGAAVLFYQPDLDLYEMSTGPLIPRDDEYIGMRIFDEQNLERALDHIIENGTIQLVKARNDEYKKRYEAINAFHDGKNVERIYKALVDRNII